MKQNHFILPLFAVFTISLFSCSKKELTLNQERNNNPSRLSIQNAKQNLEKFAKILSKGVAGDPAIRAFIKKKALEQVDNDYDVIYNFVKDEQLSNGKTFRDALVSFTNEKDSFPYVESNLPFATIYVPQLPSGFDANTWDASGQIPYVVSYVKRGQDRLMFYKNGGDTLSLTLDKVPGFPTLVVKNNERLTNVSNKVPGGTPVSYNKDDFRFIDKTFDRKANPLGVDKNSTYSITEKNMVITGIPLGMSRDRIINALSNQQHSGASAKDIAVALPYDIDTVLLKNDPRLMTAYTTMGTNGTYWQRDNIYYGLTPTTTLGPINNSIYERLYALRFSVDALNKMSDQPGDAMYINKPAPQGFNPPQSIWWTEGNFEFQIDILINDVSGNGSTITKYLTISPQDLYTVVFSAINFFGAPLYVVLGVMPKHYYPEQHAATIPLLTWDIKNRSFSWKFSFTENDLQSVNSTSESVTGQFATNFEFNVGWGTIIKKGLKFGASTTTTHTQNYSITTTLQSDPLGTIETNFGEPVMCPRDTSKHGYTTPGQPVVYTSKLPYTYYEAKNPYVSIVLLPQKQF